MKNSKEMNSGRKKYLTVIKYISKQIKASFEGAVFVLLMKGSSVKLIIFFNY